MTHLPESLSFENDEDGEFGTEHEQWLIRDPNSDNNDIVAVVPKTGDEQHDNDVTHPLVVLLTAAPQLLASIQRFFAAPDPASMHHAMVAMEDAVVAATGMRKGTRPTNLMDSVKKSLEN